MTAGGVRIGFLATREYASALGRALSGAGVRGEASYADPATADVRATLLAWDRDHVEVAVVEEEGVPDMASAVSAVRYFQAAPRPDGAVMRVVYVVAPSRLSTDPDVSALAGEGVYDLVLPARGDDKVAKAAELVERPASRQSVVTLLDPNHRPYVVDSGRGEDRGVPEKTENTPRKARKRPQEGSVKSFV